LLKFEEGGDAQEEELKSTKIVLQEAEPLVIEKNITHKEEV